MPKVFTVSSWWNSSFRLIQKAGGSLASFAKSFFRKPAIPSEVRGTAVMWPMPLPYPFAYKSRPKVLADDSEVAFQRGVNLCVLVLDWLHLKRPPTCPIEIVLHSPLSKLQWRVVRHIEFTMYAWRVAEPVTASNMGRAAEKVYSIEKALETLTTFEDGLFSFFDELLTEESGLVHSSASRKRFAPGLQAQTGGDVIGSVPAFGKTVAKPIVADRLEFKGTPKFDPSPFLDSQCRFIFEQPLLAAMSPEQLSTEVPVVRLFGDESELWKLFKKLDASHRLGAIPDTEIIPGFQAGLFSVGKDESKDRLIFDSRPFNLLESSPNRFIRSMAAASNLTELHLGASEVALVSGTDLREFYYTFVVNDQRLIRNSLLFLTEASKISGWNCCTEEVQAHPGKIWLGLRTLAMGDTCAVEIAQTAHVGILRQMGILQKENLLAMNLSPPRAPSFLGVVIDDLIAFEFVAREAWQNGGGHKSSGVVSAAVERFKTLGLIPHEGKTFYDQPCSEFWGAAFDGDRGTVRATLKRMIPILFATVGVLKLGVCSISLLQVLVGCWTSAFLFRRRLLSIFNSVYEVFQRVEDQKAVIRLSESLSTELALCISLCPLAATCLRTRTSAKVFCSDASSQGWAVVSAPLPSWLQNELHRHCLRKHVWTKLLSPLKALLKERDVLDPSDELPDGTPLESHPLWLLVARSLQFSTEKSRRTKEGRHINVDELQGMLETERVAVDEGFPVRFFSLADSQVSLGAILKGRSSSIGLNALLQESLPVHLGCGAIGNHGYLPSKENPADDPTRSVPIRSPVSPQPFWFDDSSACSFQDRLSEMDAWLADLKVSPWHLSGIPDLSELDGEFEEDATWLRSKRQKTFLNSQRRPRSKFSSKLVKIAEREDSSRAALPVCIFPEVSDPKVFPPSVPVETEDSLLLPTADSLGLPHLSAEAMAFLKTVPREYFMFPESWAVSSDWIPDFPGYLDLYSGKKGIASAICKSGKAWALTFEIEDSLAQDLSLEQNRTLVESIIRLEAVHTLGAAIFCQSFSRAVRPPVRTKVLPWGIDKMSEKMQQKVQLGNDHAEWLSRVIQLCRQHKIRFWVENPDSSFLWFLPCWEALGARDTNSCFRLDYCVCGCPWRKRTRFFTDLHLKGQHSFCARDHKHLRLVGWSRLHRKAWTRVAQVYPRRLVQWISFAVLSDAGLLPGRKKISVATVARQTHGRIGEAKNPGPRRVFRARRSVHLLDEMDIVEPQTALLGERVWWSFRNWACRSLAPETFESVVLCPETLCLLIECFGRYLFEEGHSIYLLRQLITFCQRWKPQFRGSLRGAWQLVSRWEQIQPLRHRTPLPLVAYRAMISVALMWRWFRWAAVTMIAFEGITRPGEVLSANRGDLLLPRDLLVEDPAVVFLQIRNPKGRRRGLGAVQHAKIIDGRLALFLGRIFGRRERTIPLFPGSFSSYRKRWDAVLNFLKVPSKLGLTPASLRAGGAVRAYRANEEIARLMWRMRLRNIDTLQHYLQETGAASIFMELPGESRTRVQNAALLFDTLMDAFLP